MHFFAPVSPEVAFDYFADPRRRPQWQSSLSRVEDVDGEPRLGQTWVDVTKPGLRPAMETTVFERPGRWAERCTWRGVSADLSLVIRAAPGGCEIEVTMQLVGRGLLALPLRAVNLVAPLAVRADMRTAIGLLSRTS